MNRWNSQSLQPTVHTSCYICVLIPGRLLETYSLALNHHMDLSPMTNPHLRPLHQSIGQSGMVGNVWKHLRVDAIILQMYWILEWIPKWQNKIFCQSFLKKGQENSNFCGAAKVAKVAKIKAYSKMQKKTLHLLKVINRLYASWRVTIRDCWEYEMSRIFPGSRIFLDF